MSARIAIALCLALAAAGCDVSMTQQDKYTTYAPAAAWRDGASARPLPAGVVAQGEADDDALAANPPPATLELVRRGQERFGIFCAPCHGLAGDGDGIVVKHGFPSPPPFERADLLAMPAPQIYDVITHGHGVMYAYASRVPPRDRWAIVAYIRALQLSHHATVAQAPEAAERLP